MRNEPLSRPCKEMYVVIPRVFGCGLPVDLPVTAGSTRRISAISISAWSHLEPCYVLESAIQAILKEEWRSLVWVEIIDMAYDDHLGLAAC